MKKQFVIHLIGPIILLFLPALLRAQNSCHMILETGGNVDFKVYSLNYYNQGMTYEDYTTLHVSCDTLWYLGVISQDSEFLCNYPDQSLSLDYVEIKATEGNGQQSFGSELNTNKITLSDTEYKTIVNGADGGNYKVNLSYYLDSVKGQHPGYYNTNFIFRMDTIPISSW